MSWEIEEIPDEDNIFYRIHKNMIDSKEIMPGAFYETGSGDSRGMSTDWAKYGTAHKTKKGGKQKPENYAVISFIAGRLRNEIDLIVRHSPSPNNRAHSLVNGIDVERPKKEEIRLKLLDMFDWEIKLINNPEIDK